MSEHIIADTPQPTPRVPARLELTRRNWWVNLSLGLLFLQAQQALAEHPPAILGWTVWSVLGLAGLVWRYRVRTVVVVDPEAARITCTQYGIRHVTADGVELDRVLRVEIVASDEVLDTLVLHLLDGESWVIGSNTSFGLEALREVGLRVKEIVEARSRKPELPPEPLEPRPAPAMQLAAPEPAVRVA